MARTKKQAESDDEPGAPEWMVTFSDCMTLLLTFFVLLLSFSSFDDNRVFLRLKIIYSKALTSIAPITQIERNALFYLAPVKYVAELDKGSETSTSEQGLEDGLMKEAKIMNLTTGVAFLVPSKKFFWAKGSALSVEGRRILDTMTPLLKASPSRIVISENGAVDGESGENFGLSRAWAVMEYFVARGGLDKRRFSICGQSAVPTKGAAGGPASREPERVLEVVLLERSIYN